MKTILPTFLFFLACCGLWAQNPDVILTNNSFEDTPGTGIVPKGWFNCGFEAETPPDLHPTAVYDIGMSAHHGNTFVGMVIRDNGTWEGLGQELLTPLIENQCYTLSFYAARSETMESLSRMTDELVNYNVPAVVQIWGGHDECEQRELLGESFPIESTEWEQYEFVLFPSDTFRFITIEAYYQREYPEAYNGNVLIDHFSDLKAVPCDSIATILADVPPTDSTNISFEKMIIEASSSSDQLEEIILENAGAIRFEFNNELYTTFFENSEGDLVGQNPGVYKIAKAALGLPDVKLKFALAAYSDVGYEKRKAVLLNALQSLGLSLEQLTIVRQQTGVEQEAWLWQDSGAEAWVKVLE
ncbi:MAG: hypothetical protein AAF798_05995 [Bacteroidota bacterium]